jgi:hypothetical protein
MEIIGDDFCELVAENASAPIRDKAAVDVIDEPHRRRIPKMLTKKLERIV